MNRWILAFAGMLLLMMSCQVPVAKPPLVQTIAILPFDNESNDINADTIMQSYVYLAMKGGAYQVFDINETNAKLEKVGIVDGGQLPALDPVKIAKDFGVQALMYGNVESFGYVNIGFYAERKVRLELKLVDGATGETLWENSQSMATRKFATNKDEASDNFLKGLAEQTTEKLFNSPLEGEARGATIKTLSSLPGFRFNGFPALNSGSNAVKKFINKE